MDDAVRIERERLRGAASGRRRDVFGALLCAVLFLGVGPGVHADPTTDAAAASAVAAHWLGLVDANNYAEAWLQLHPTFQATLSRDAWLAQLAATRKEFGALHARREVGARYANALPGAPPGEYVVVQYESRYTHRAELLETVVPMRDADGSWRVAGHFFAARQPTARQ